MVLTVHSLPRKHLLVEMCLKLTLKTPERRQWTYFTSFCSVSIVYFEQVNVR